MAIRTIQFILKNPRVLENGDCVADLIDINHINKATVSALKFHPFNGFGLMEEFADVGVDPQVISYFNIPLDIENRILYENTEVAKTLMASMIIEALLSVSGKEVCLIRGVPVKLNYRGETSTQEILQFAQLCLDNARYWLL